MQNPAQTNDALWHFKASFFDKAAPPGCYWLNKYLQLWCDFCLHLLFTSMKCITLDSIWHWPSTDRFYVWHRLWMSYTVDNSLALSSSNSCSPIQQCCNESSFYGGYNVRKLLILFSEVFSCSECSLQKTFKRTRDIHQLVLYSKMKIKLIQVGCNVNEK